MENEKAIPKAEIYLMSSGTHKDTCGPDNICSPDDSCEPNDGLCDPDKECDPDDDSIN